MCGSSAVPHFQAALNTAPSCALLAAASDTMRARAWKEHETKSGWKRVTSSKLQDGVEKQKGGSSPQARSRVSEGPRSSAGGIKETIS